MRVRLLPSLALLPLLSCSSSTSPLPLSGDAVIGGLTVHLESEPPKLKVSRADGRVLLETAGADGEGVGAFATADIGAKVEFGYGSFKFTDVPRSPWRGATKLTVTANSGSALRFDLTDGTGTVLTGEIAASGDHGLALDLTAPEGPTRSRFAFTCEAGEHFAGFGGQTDALDHRGHKVPVWVSEQGIGKSQGDDPPDLWQLEGARHSTHFPLPYAVSSRGTGLLLRGERRSVWDVCKADGARLAIENWDTQNHFVLFDGPSIAEVTERATVLLGRQREANALELSPWNDAIRGPAEVRRVAQVLRQNHIPSGAIWTEDFRGGAQKGDAYRLVEEWDLDPTLYPDTTALVSELHAQGISWFAYFNPFVVSETRIYAEAEAAGVLVKDRRGQIQLFGGPTFVPTALVDLSSEAGRRFVRTHLDRALDVGFDGWMTDFAEWLPTDAALADGRDGWAGHQGYPLAWQQASKEAIDARTARDGRPRTFFVRSGFIGTNAISPVVWAGDQRTDFQADDGLPSVIPMALNLGLGGVSTFGSDVAGYQSATNPASTKELFFRWTELSALMPVLRTHHGTNDRQNWAFDRDAETLAHWGRWARLHTRLWPLFRSLSREATTRGLPMLRALPFAAPAHEEAWKAIDSWLLGEQLFVAPVVTAGATSRSLWLPPGTWLPLFGVGGPQAGAQTLTVDAPLGELPAFARAGTVLSLLPERLESLLPAEPPVVDLQDVGSERELWAFLGASGQFAEVEGATFVLESSAGALPDRVEDAQGAIPACVSGTPNGRCVAFDGARRTAVIHQAAMPLSALQGAQKVGTLTVQGTTPSRLDVRLRW